MQKSEADGFYCIVVPGSETALSDPDCLHKTSCKKDLMMHSISAFWTLHHSTWLATKTGTSHGHSLYCKGTQPFCLPVYGEISEKIYRTDLITVTSQRGAASGFVQVVAPVPGNTKHIVFDRNGTDGKSLARALLKHLDSCFFLLN